MNTTHIDVGLARYSDWAYTSALVVLVLALVLLAVELAYAGSRRVDARERTLVGAGAPVSDADDPAVPGVVPAARNGRWPNGSAARAWRWSTSASGCCSPASRCAGWPPCARRGATCTSSST